MNKHTPGPWHAKGPDDFWDFNILHDGDSLAVAAVVSNMRPLDEISANARLVAAAPELLAALQDCVAVMELDLAGLRVIQPELNQARAALAAARGDQ